MIQTQQATFKKLQKQDWYSTLRNWGIVNASILISCWDKLEQMFINWNFDWIVIRQMVVVSIFSFVLFTVKRYFTGTIAE